MFNQCVKQELFVRYPADTGGVEIIIGLEFFGFVGAT